MGIPGKGNLLVHWDLKRFERRGNLPRIEEGRPQRTRCRERIRAWRIRNDTRLVVHVLAAVIWSAACSRLRGVAPATGRSIPMAPGAVGKVFRQFFPWVWRASSRCCCQATHSVPRARRVRGRQRPCPHNAGDRPADIVLFLHLYFAPGRACAARSSGDTRWRRASSADPLHRRHSPVLRLLPPRSAQRSLLELAQRRRTCTPVGPFDAS